MKVFIILFGLCLIFSGLSQAAGTDTRSVAQAVSKKEVADLKRTVESQRKEIAKIKGLLGSDTRAKTDMKKNIDAQNRTIEELSNQIEKLLNLIEIQGNTVKFSGDIEVAGAAEIRGDIDAAEIKADRVSISRDLEVGIQLKVGGGTRILASSASFEGVVTANQVNASLVRSNNKELVSYGAKVTGSIGIPGIGSVPVLGTSLTISP